MTDELDNEEFDKERALNTIRAQRAENKAYKERIKELESILSDRITAFYEAKNKSAEKFFQFLKEENDRKLKKLFQALWVSDPDSAEKLQEEFNGREVGIATGAGEEEKKISNEFEDVLRLKKNEHV